jgi:4-amino-4-deoxy-L-arabinose transferase-like glycosyltransferase
MERPQRRWLEIALVAGVCALLFCSRLGAFGLLGADEPRYAQIAREMLERHDWVTPILYGQPWLEKPIALYWGEMVSYKIFGVSDASARVPAALLASLMVVFVYAWLKRFRPQARLDGALMVASAALVIGMGRAASTDIVLCAPLTVAMLAWFGWYSSGHRGWLALYYAMTGVGMLAKGPVAPLFAGVIVAAFCAITRDYRRIVQTLWVPGILIFCAVALPWYVLVQHRTPEFFNVFVLKHNLARFGSNAFRHKQPFWYYLPVMLVATAPWTVFVIAAFVQGGRDVRDALRKVEANLFAVYLLLWTAIPVLFFSLSQSKLPGYVLPAVPPALLLAADYIHLKAAKDEPLPFWMAGAHAVLLAALTGAVMVAPAILLRTPAPLPALMLAAAVGTIVLIGVVLALFLRGWGMLRFATLVPVVLVISFVLRSLGPTIDATQTARPVAQILTGVGIDPKMPIYTFKVRRDTAFGLGFYRNQFVNSYEGLEISPGTRVTQPSIPRTAHVVVARDGSESDLRELFDASDWSITPVGFLRPQRLTIFEVRPSR